GPAPCTVLAWGRGCSPDVVPLVVGGVASAPRDFFAGGADATPLATTSRGAGATPLLRHNETHDTGQGSASQMLAAYSAMVRSLENLPELATLRMALRAQASGSAYSAVSFRSASR